jgi:spore coat protein A
MIERRRFLYGTALLLGSCRRRSGDPVDSGLCEATVSAAPLVPPLHPETLAKFVDPLPAPPVLKLDGERSDPESLGRSIPYVRIAMREGTMAVHRDLPPTRVWGYAGICPGPTIEARSGKPLLLEWANELPERHFLPIDHSLCGNGPGMHEARAVVHVHGARVPPSSDGYPEAHYPPGRSALYRYPNDQDAATLWYHDHAMGIERLNQYAGLFGAFLVRDDVEDALRLPSGPYEVPLFFTDRLLDAKGQLVYPTSGDAEQPWIPEVRGDAQLVNGKLAPYLDVEPRLYRFRVVNASNTRTYSLQVDSGVAIHQIGSDQGLLPAPVPIPDITLAPAERADVLLDFASAAGKRVVMQNLPTPLLQFRVAPSSGPIKPSPLPKVLRPAPRMLATSAVKTRTMTLNEYMNPKTQAMTMLLNGARWAAPVTETPSLGSVEIWELVNLTDDTHPIHLHMVRFQILERQAFDEDHYITHQTMRFTGAPVPPAPQDAGWKDTARADPGFVTRLIVKFDGYAGRYAWHCHLLEHAANEMMRPYDVVA